MALARNRQKAERVNPIPFVVACSLPEPSILISFHFSRILVFIDLNFGRHNQSIAHNICLFTATLQHFYCIVAFFALLIHREYSGINEFYRLVVSLALVVDAVEFVAFAAIFLPINFIH